LLDSSEWLPTIIPTMTDPGHLRSYRAQTGETLHFVVRGETNNSLCGTGTYTDDSDLTAAAVHSRALRDGECGVVEVTILPGQSTY
jgi:hypothetical protein